MENIHKVYAKIKHCLALSAEQYYNWRPNDTVFTYNTEEALLRSVSKNHTASLTHITEKFALHFITARLSANSKVVEVGSFLGGSAAIMAHANPKIQIVGIDVFDQKKHAVVKEQQQMIEETYGPGKSRTRENAQSWIDQFHKNVRFFEAKSPDGCEELAQEIGPIDMYFEDSVHVDPGLKKNMDFWFPKIKNGGLLLMHDYRPWMKTNGTTAFRFEDVERHVERLVSTKKAEFIGTVRGLAILRKF